MKRFILPLVAGILLSHGVQAAVQSLPFTDHFNYPQGNLYTVAPGVWDAGGSAGTEITVQTNAALTGPSGFAASSGNGVRWQPGGTARRNIVQFSSITSNNVGAEVYASFLLNNISAPGTSRLIAYLENIAGSTVSSPQLGIFLNGSTLGIGKKASAPAVTTTIGSGPQLVVVRYTFLAGNDQADLWVNPTNTSYGAASPPPSLGNTTGASDPANITYFAFNGTSGSGPTLYYDEVRISTNWADVVPGTPPPPPATAPQITNVVLTGEGFVIEGNNGTSNGVFGVLAASDMNVPVEGWSEIGQHNFDGTGSFSVTNPVPDGTEYEFFALRVTDTSTNTPPEITSQPQNQQVLEGQTAQFVVAATGSVPLRYQWFFNTNTVLSAGTNATLNVSNVQSNNVGGYSVLVSNTAGSVTSVVAFLTLGEPVTNGNFYVSPTGNDNNPGTYGQPFFSLQKAATLAQAGHVIYVRGGTFDYVSTIRLTNSGTAGAPIKIWAYPGEKPVLNFSGQPVGASSRGLLLTTNTTTGVGGDYWHIKGLEIKNCGDNAVKVEGSHNLIELCVFHNNEDTGLQIGFSHTPVNNLNKAAFNTVINCDSYLNYDSDNRGSDADGFACKLHPGQSNVFVSCRAWKNSDDGWDLFETDATVIISNCWSWHNGDATQYNVVGGSFQGNGNGIKLGGNGSGGSSVGVHYALNCVSFNNNFPGRTRHGFDQNSHHGGLVLYNCLAFGNLYNYFIEDSAGSNPQIVRNCISNNGSVSSFGSGTVESNNSWNSSNHSQPNPAVGAVNTADFNSLAESAAEAPREPDGSLPTGFARIINGSSNLIDKGVDVGLPYCGSAPDLGAFEYCP